MRFATTPRVVLAGLLMLMGASRSEAAPFSFDFFANQQGWSGSWLASGGNPGGFLTATQVVGSGAGTGSFNVSVGPSITISPPPFAAADFASTLWFDTRLVSVTTNTHDFRAVSVLLAGMGGPQAFSLQYELDLPLGPDWTTIGLPLNSGTLFLPGGQPPSQSLTQALLETYLPQVAMLTLLDGFLVDRGTGLATVTFGFDNIRLVAPTAQPPTNSVVPEPATLSLLGLGLAGAARRYRRRSLPQA